MQALHGYRNMADKEINQRIRFDAVNDVLKRDLMRRLRVFSPKNLNVRLASDPFGTDDREE